MANRNPAHNKYLGQGGVSRAWRWVQLRSGQRYQVHTWRAHIRIGGRQHETSYSIAKHGDERARELATAWLEKKRKEKRAFRRAFLREQKAWKEAERGWRPRKKA